MLNEFDEQFALYEKLAISRAQRLHELSSDLRVTGSAVGKILVCASHETIHDESIVYALERAFSSLGHESDQLTYLLYQSIDDPVTLAIEYIDPALVVVFDGLLFFHLTTAESANETLSETSSKALTKELAIGSCGWFRARRVIYVGDFIEAVKAQNEVLKREIWQALKQHAAHI